MDGHAAFEALRQVEAPDGRFWSVHCRWGVLACVVEAVTEALPQERFRWKVAGITKGRPAAQHVANALRSGDVPTPDRATLISHTVAARVLPSTGNVTLV